MLWPTANHGASKPSLKRTPRATPDITAHGLARAAIQRSARCVDPAVLPLPACTVFTYAIPHPSSSSCRLSRRAQVAPGFLVTHRTRCAAARAKALIHPRSCATASWGKRADGARSMKGMVRVSDARANAQGHALRSQLEQQHTGETGAMQSDGPIDAHRSLTDQYMREYERLKVRSQKKQHLARASWFFARVVRRD